MIRACIPAFVFLSTLGAGPPADGASALIISIDGLRGDWSAHPDRHDLKIPNLRALAARGAHADAVRGIFPSVTYPSHTTLITGCRPALHGILANGVFTPPTERSSGRWFWNYKDIRVPTILDAAHAASWSTASVGWPVTVDAPADILFPEVWPAGHHDQAIAEMCRLSKPPDLIARVLTKYDLKGGDDLDVNRTNIARYIADQDRPRLMLLHLIELDHAEHSFGPESANAREALERIDGYVGTLLENYKADGLLDHTIVAIVSDHGFLPTKKNFAINVLLSKSGLIHAGDDPAGPARDWEAAGWVAGGSCAILLNSPNDRTALARVRTALAPYTGRADSPIRRILERDEITSLGSNPKAVLMLDAGDGFTFSGRLTGDLISDSSPNGKGVRGMHGQLPDRPGLEATFIAAGPGISKGADISEMKMIDVAPTLAAALGLSLPRAEGKPVQEVLANSQHVAPK